MQNQHSRRVTIFRRPHDDLHMHEVVTHLRGTFVITNPFPYYWDKRAACQTLYPARRRILTGHSPRSALRCFGGVGTLRHKIEIDPFTRLINLIQ